MLDSDPPPGEESGAAAPRQQVLEAYRDGVRVVERLGSKVVDWSLPTPCAGWRAIDLAGHLLATARRYHLILNAALAGERRDDLPIGRALAAANAEDLAALTEVTGPERIVAFDAVATRYGERLTEVAEELVIGHWPDLGTLTVAEHTTVAVAEWHLHAWDLAAALEWSYRPSDAGVVAAGMRLLPGWMDGDDPWHAALASSGRREPSPPRPPGP